MMESQGCEEAPGVCSWESPCEVETVFPRVGGLLPECGAVLGGVGSPRSGEGVPAARVVEESSPRGLEVARGLGVRRAAPGCVWGLPRDKGRVVPECEGRPRGVGSPGIFLQSAPRLGPLRSPLHPGERRGQAESEPKGAAGPGPAERTALEGSVPVGRPDATPPHGHLLLGHGESVGVPATQALTTLGSCHPGRPLLTPTSRARRV